MLGLGPALADVAVVRPHGVAFNPLSISPAALYDPTDLTHMWKDTAGTQAVTADGDAVARVDDLSGNGFHLIQSAAGSRPLYKTSGGIKWLLFDGSNDFFNITNSATMLTGYTAGTGMFAAAATSNAPAANRGHPLSFFAFAGSVDVYPNTLGGIGSTFLTSAQKNVGDPGDLTAWHVHDIRSEANNFRASHNGTDFFTTGTNTVATTTGNASYPTIGDNGGGQYYEGKLGRMAIFSSVLAGANLANMRTWSGAGSGVVL